MIGPTNVSLSLRGKALEERLINGLLDNDAINSDADLALVQKLAEHCGLDGLIQIGVREHNEGGVATELQIDSLDDRRLRRKFRVARPAGCCAFAGPSIDCALDCEDRRAIRLTAVKVTICRAP
jgi:hypothetical protein